MARMPASEARKDLAELLNRVAFGGERIVLHRRGKDAAALVSIEDLAILKALEDRFDLEPVRAIIQRAEQAGEPPARAELVRALDPLIHLRAGHA